MARTRLVVGLNGSQTIAFTAEEETARDAEEKEWADGSSTPFGILDDKYSITGHASGNGVNGNSFTMSITEPLHVDLGCLPSCIIKSGEATISPSGYSDRIINYGDSICDCNIDVTINGTTYPIVN